MSHKTQLDPTGITTSLVNSHHANHHPARTTVPAVVHHPAEMEAMVEAITEAALTVIAMDHPCHHHDALAVTHHLLEDLSTLMMK